MFNRPRKIQIFYTEQRPPSSYIPANRFANKNMNNLNRQQNFKKPVSTNKSIKPWPKLLKDDESISTKTFPKIKEKLNFSQNKKNNFARNKTSYFHNEDLIIDDLNNEDFITLQYLWNDLGITGEYQEQFTNYISSLKLEKKKKFNFIRKKFFD